MAYSKKIHMKEYKRLRIWLSVKKVAEFAIPTAAVFGLLHYSKYCPLVGTLFFSGIFALWWFKKTQILDFFLPDWEGEVVEKIAWRDVKPRAKLEIVEAGKATAGSETGLDFHPPKPKPSYNCRLTVRRNSDGKLFYTTYNEYVPDGFHTDVIYFRQGETVRHHRCLPLYEKLDKSKERKLICFKCGRFADKYEEKCWHCGLPVLSEETEYVKKTHNLFEGEKRSDRTW